LLRRFPIAALANFFKSRGANAAEAGDEMQADTRYVVVHSKAASSNMHQPVLSRTEPRGAACSGAEGSGV